MCDSLWPHGLQHSKLFCPFLSPRVRSNSCPLSQWCCLTISSSAAPFSFCLLSFSASGSFPVSCLFTWCGQAITASASASVLPMNIQLISFRIDWFDLLAVQGTLKSLLQHYSLKASILWHSAFFMDLTKSWNSVYRLRLLWWMLIFWKYQCFVYTWAFFRIWCNFILYILVLFRY